MRGIQPGGDVPETFPGGIRGKPRCTGVHGFGQDEQKDLRSGRKTAGSQCSTEVDNHHRPRIRVAEPVPQLRGIRQHQGIRMDQRLPAREDHGPRSSPCQQLVYETWLHPLHGAAVHQGGTYRKYGVEQVVRRQLAHRQVTFCLVFRRLNDRRRGLRMTHVSTVLTRGDNSHFAGLAYAPRRWRKAVISAGSQDSPWHIVVLDASQSTVEA
jgi:hypothetical protein